MYITTVKWSIIVIIMIFVYGSRTAKYQYHPKTHLTRGVAAILLHLLTKVRAYTVLLSPQAMNQCSPWPWQAI